MRSMFIAGSFPVAQVVYRAGCPSWQPLARLVASVVFRWAADVPTAHRFVHGQACACQSRMTMPWCHPSLGIAALRRSPAHVAAVAWLSSTGKRAPDPAAVEYQGCGGRRANVTRRRLNSAPPTPTNARSAHRWSHTPALRPLRAERMATPLRPPGPVEEPSACATLKTRHP